MAKTSASRPVARGAERSVESSLKDRAGRKRAVRHDAKTGQSVVSKARFEAVMRAAEQLKNGSLESLGHAASGKQLNALFGGFL